VAFSTEDNEVVLQLQALPYSGGHMRANPSFNQDELAVIIVASFALELDAFDGTLAAGPKPIFVSSNPDEAVSLLQNQEAAHRLCQALAARLKTTEALTAEQAVGMGPLPRIGKTSSPLVRNWIRQEAATDSSSETREPANKRAREEQVSAAAADNSGVAGKLST
jgi:hypothetical protein